MLFSACGHDHDLIDPVIVARSAVELRSAVSADAVLGVERTLTADGQMIDERVVDTGDYPANLAELVETGAVGPDGKMYARSYGMFSDGERMHQYDHIEVVHTQPKTPRDGEAAGTPAPPAEGKVISRDLEQRIANRPGHELVRVRIKPKARPLTSIARKRSPLGYTSMAWADEERAEHQARLRARKDEVAALHAPLLAALEDVGAGDVATFWLSGWLGATLPLRAISVITTRPDVAQVLLNEEVMQSGNWNGSDMKHGSGLSANFYVNNGLDGDLSSPNIRIGVIDQTGFYTSHSGFKEDSGTIARIHSTWTCSDTACTAGVLAPLTDHGTTVAGLAAGDHNDGQVAGQTATWELERTGACEECQLVLLDTSTTFDSYEQALQKAVDVGVNVIAHSEWGGASPACDSLAAGVETATYDAHTAGVLVVQIAGNGGNGGSCNLAGTPEILSALVVGGLGNDSDDCDAQIGALAGCGIYSSSSRGGMPITVNGVVHGSEISQMVALAPACPQYQYTRTGGFNSSTTLCGTSYAAPQVAGAAGLFADWHISDFGASLSSGTLFSWMQMMTDRGTSASVKATSGMHDVWGAGRFQMRYFGDYPSGGGANESGAWAWEATRYTVSNSTADIVNPMLDSAVEPSTIQQYKAHLTFFEEDNTNAADVTLEIWKANCTGSASTNRIRRDVSYDLRKMVRASASEAAGQQLCAKVLINHVPGTQTRDVILKQYYSTSTAFR